jgi:hypothetical protein
MTSILISPVQKHKAIAVVVLSVEVPGATAIYLVNGELFSRYGSWFLLAADYLQRLVADLLSNRKAAEVADQ